MRIRRVRARSRTRRGRHAAPSPSGIATIIATAGDEQRAHEQRQEIEVTDTRCPPVRRVQSRLELDVREERDRVADSEAMIATLITSDETPAARKSPRKRRSRRWRRRSTGEVDRAGSRSSRSPSCEAPRISGTSVSGRVIRRARGRPPRGESADSPPSSVSTELSSAGGDPLVGADRRLASRRWSRARTPHRSRLA